jgi:GTP-binding protein
LRIVSSRFERAASKAEDEPRAAGPDVVFVGRSNVGKSALINRLLGAKELARTSARPGRTQTINFYRVNESCYFVDLPGYGYAAVPESVRRSWKPMVEGFLDRRRERISITVLVVDARRDPTELDRVMRDWLAAKRIPYVVAVTKVDKLSASQRSRAERVIEAGLGDSRQTAPRVMVSARSGLGIAQLWRHIDAAVAGRRGPKGGRNGNT